MPIKPIDMQVIIPKSLEVAKINNDDNQKSSALQYQQAMSVQHKVDDNLKQVYLTNKTYEAAIREKPAKDKGGGEKNKKEKEADKHEKKKGIDAIKRTSIDIKI